MSSFALEQLIASQKSGIETTFAILTKMFDISEKLLGINTRTVKLTAPKIMNSCPSHSRLKSRASCSPNRQAWLSPPWKRLSRTGVTFPKTSPAPRQISQRSPKHSSGSSNTMHRLSSKRPDESAESRRNSRRGMEDIHHDSRRNGQPCVRNSHEGREAGSGNRRKQCQCDLAPEKRIPC